LGHVQKMFCFFFSKTQFYELPQRVAIQLQIFLQIKSLTLTRTLTALQSLYP
jgi:hypothetical protein